MWGLKGWWVLCGNLQETAEKIVLGSQRGGGQQRTIFGKHGMAAMVCASKLVP